MQWLKKTLKENKGFILFIVLMVVFRSAIADWNDVPTGSMKPTIVEGDRILVDKLAYDIRLPFSKVSLKKLSDPMVGDIIIFDSKAADKRLVKRVVGVPGDTVAMINNRLIINGKALDYQMVSSSFENQEKIETLGGITHKIYTHSLGSQLSNFPMVTIPQGQYLALGDNLSLIHI